jgi:hypothetical protein
MRGAVLFLNAGSGARPCSTMHTPTAAALVPNFCLYVGYMKVQGCLLANVRLRATPLSSSVTDMDGRQTDTSGRCHPIAHGPKRHADSACINSYAIRYQFVSSSSCNVSVKVLTVYNRIYLEMTRWHRDLTYLLFLSRYN